MRPRVLVIDDDAAFRLLGRVNLEAEGMPVLEAADGPSGVEAARSGEPDVILLGVTMTPDSWRAAEQLRADPRTASTPIVFMPTEAELRHRPDDLDTAGVYYITRPFNPVNLAPLVRRLLDS